eukprot:1944-Eustigmatos_ZCMA.PRE.1
MSSTPFPPLILSGLKSSQRRQNRRSDLHEATQARRRSCLGAPSRPGSEKRTLHDSRKLVRIT